MFSLLLIFLSVLSFTIFHSLFAQEFVKKKIEKYFGSFFVEHVYRVLYCLISWTLLYPVSIYALYNSDAALIDPLFFLSESIRIIIALLKLFGVFILYLGLLQYDYLEFLGIKQLWNGLNKQIFKTKFQFSYQIKGVEAIEAEGIYKIVRNPMMIGASLILIPTTCTFAEIIFYILILLYIWIGCHIEENRLERNLGKKYIEYKESVDSYFPWKWLKKNIWSTHG